MKMTPYGRVSSWPSAVQAASPHCYTLLSINTSIYPEINIAVDSTSQVDTNN